MSLQPIENSLCRAQRDYQTNADKIGRGLLALIDLTYHVTLRDEKGFLDYGRKKTLRNIRKLASKLMHQLGSVRYSTD